MLLIRSFRVLRTRAGIRELCSGGCSAVFIDMKTFKKNIKPGAKSVTVPAANGRKQTIDLVQISAGVASRWLFICPECGKRVNRLYVIRQGWMCAKCAGINPYAGVQTTTRGGADELLYRMQRFAFQKGISFDFPFDYIRFVKDSRVKKQSFRDALKVLQSLENMRTQALFFNKRYNAGLIRQVITLKHPLLKTCTLEDLRCEFYDWQTGKRITINDMEIRAAVLKGVNRGKQ